jgi:predicted dehydrogenase
VSPPVERVVVVGTGSFGQRRGEALARRGVSVAFVSRDLERARAATARLGGPVAEASTDLARALAWGEAVFVATPPACHSEPVLAAARAGRPVLVEKPVEATLARARALEAALGASARLVTVAENFHFLSALASLEELRASAGPLVYAEVVVHRKRAPAGWRREGPLAGGGVLADVGIHYVHLLRVLLGDLVLERAPVSARLGSIETAIALAGRSACGARFTLDLSWAASRNRSRVLLVGERRRVHFRVGKRWIWRATRGGLPTGVTRVGADALGHEALLDDWLGASARGEPGQVTLARGIADLALVDAAYAASPHPYPPPQAGEGGTAL